MKIILISGKAQHGKDESAKYINTVLTNKGQKVLVIHYADALKNVLKSYFGWNGSKDGYGRWLLQYVGTDVIRHEQPDFWVKNVADILKFFPNEWDYVIIPDTRFPNEIEYMKQLFDVKTIRVTRRNFENSLSEEAKKHSSETALDDYLFDEFVFSETIEELHEKLDGVIERL